MTMNISGKKNMLQNMYPTIYILDRNGVGVNHNVHIVNHAWF